MRAAYDKIYRELKSQIEDGTYGYEDFLPSQAVLVKRFDCAHNTVRKALAMLAAEGYCQPIHGKGVRVIWRPQDTHSAFTLGGIEPFADTARRNDLDGGTQVKVFEHLVCDEQLAALSGFAVGTELLHVERIRFLDDQAAITDPATNEKERRTNIRQIRSNLNYGNVPGLLEYLQSCTDPKVQVTLLEALGWHGHAWNAGEIAKVAESMASDDALPEEVRSEAMKTYKRITE